MHTGESRWELLNINAAKKCLLYFNTDIENINQRSRLFNIRITLKRNKLISRRSTEIETSLDIRDHGDIPFKQTQIFYPEENITEINVAAHKEFENNSFFMVPNIGLRISIVGNHTCILADIDAFKIDDIEESKFTIQSVFPYIFRIFQWKF